MALKIFNKLEGDIPLDGSRLELSGETVLRKFNTNTVLLGGSNQNITGSSYNNHSLVENLAIMDSPSGGSSGDTILVRDSSTGIIRQIAQSGVTSGGGSSLTFNNGLTETEGTVSLGGTLTGDTNINSVNFGVNISNNGTISSASTRSHIIGGIGNTISGVQRDSMIINGYNSYITNNGVNSFFGWNQSIGESNKITQYQVGGNGRISNAMVLGYKNSVCLSGGTNIDIFNPTLIGVSNSAINLNNGRFNNMTAIGANNITKGSATLAMQSNACAYAKGALAIGFNEDTNFTGVGGQGILASGYRAINISTNNASQTLNHGATAARSAIFAGLNSHIDTGNTNTVLIGGMGIKLTGSTYVNHAVVPNLTIYNTPSGGTSGDTVLVRDSSTGIIKQINQSGIGGTVELNILNISGTTTSTISDNNHVLIIDTSTAPQTVTLPSSPSDGLVFKIKDSGNAATNNITISGNTKNIDGLSTATIDTNYGGYEIIYFVQNDAWYILSFNN